MCLVLFAYDADARHTLVVAANRDELYARDASAAHYWDSHPELLAGRDLTGGGTWLGVTTNGRFAAVTNYAAAAPTGSLPDKPLSRGALTCDFLSTSLSCEQYVSSIDPSAYRGFNLLIWDGESLICTSNIGITQTLSSGIYGLTNAGFGARWPKVVRGTDALAACLAAGVKIDALLRLLNDEVQPPDNRLPQIGRPLDVERHRATCFIRGQDYGTRASTAILLSPENVTFAEQAYGPQGQPGERHDYSFAPR